MTGWCSINSGKRTLNKEHDNCALENNSVQAPGHTWRISYDTFLLEEFFFYLDPSHSHHICLFPLPLSLNHRCATTRGLAKTTVSQETLANGSGGYNGFVLCVADVCPVSLGLVLAPDLHINEDITMFCPGGWPSTDEHPLTVSYYTGIQIYKTHMHEAG